MCVGRVPPSANGDAQAPAFAQAKPALYFTSLI
jgi:hypothetical protein